MSSAQSIAVTYNQQSSGYLRTDLQAANWWVMSDLTWNFVELFMVLSLRYADTLIKLRGEALAKGQEFLTWNDVQKCIDTVNVQVHEEHERKKVLQAFILVVILQWEICALTNKVSNGSYCLPAGIIAIAEINEALNSGDHQQTLAALLLPTAKLTGVNSATAKHYHDVLQYTKQLLCQVL